MCKSYANNIGVVRLARWDRDSYSERERYAKREYERQVCVRVWGVQIIGLLSVRCGLTWCHTSTHPLNPWRTVRKIWIRNLERSMADKRSTAGLCRFSRDKCRARGSDAWVLDTLWRARWRSAGFWLQVSVSSTVSGRLERGSVNIGLEGEAVLYDDKRKNVLGCRCL